MALTDPTILAAGFEGVITQSDSPPDFKNPIGFEGVLLFPEDTKTPRNPLGFEGIYVTYSDVERFIKVTDYRGMPLRGVLVTAQNSGGSISAITGSNGIVALEIDETGTVPILLQKDKTFKSLSYIHASEETLKEVILQPPLL